jgi:hypothetical protein
MHRILPGTPPPLVICDGATCVDGFVTRTWAIVSTVAVFGMIQFSLADLLAEKEY